MKSHVVPEQTSLPFAGVEQTGQAPLHRRRPWSHVMPHAPFEQVAVPPVGVEQSSHLLPQLVVAESETQRCPHACWPVGHTHAVFEHVAPEGQSVASRQPAWQARVVGLQK